MKEGSGRKDEGQMKGLHRDGQAQGPAVKAAAAGSSGGGEGSRKDLASRIEAAKRDAAGKSSGGSSPIPAKTMATATLKPQATASAGAGRGRFWRVLAGYLLACIVAAMILTAFFLKDANLANARAEDPGEWLEHFLTFTAVVSPLVALFGAPFALIGLGYAESKHIRSWLYYALLALAVALVGLLVHYSYEDEGAARTILNNFATSAFVTAGFISGFIYWMCAGRSA